MPPIQRIDEEFFLSRSSIEPISSCWVWNGSLTSRGYGQIGHNQKHYLAHRLSYMTFKGSIPKGFDLHHVCENTKCINPMHLISLSHSDHMRISENNIMTKNSNKHKCKWGHRLSGGNLVIRKHRNRAQSRECRICRMAQDRKKKFKVRKGIHLSLKECISHYDSLMN